MAPQDRDYRAFVTQLHRRMKQAGSKAALIGGVGPKTYAAGIVLLALVGIAISGLFIRAIATSEFSGALFLVGFAALFAWQIGGFVARNRHAGLYVRSFACGACCRNPASRKKAQRNVTSRCRPARRIVGA